jgi:hypothetical protein
MRAPEPDPQRFLNIIALTWFHATFERCRVSLSATQFTVFIVFSVAISGAPERARVTPRRFGKNFRR